MCYRLFLISIVLFCSCKNGKAVKLISEVNKQRKPVRYGMITGIRKEKIEEYKVLHAKPWPQVLATLKECNIENYSIYLKEIDSNFFLFSYFEYTGTDFDADMQKMAADTITKRWWKLTDPCQLPLPEAKMKSQTWSAMEEVFHMD